MQLTVLTFPKIKRRSFIWVFLGGGGELLRAVGLSIAAVVRVMKRSISAGIYSQQFSLIWGLCFKLGWPSLETVWVRFICTVQIRLTLPIHQQLGAVLIDSPSGMFTLLTGFCFYLHSLMCCYGTCPGKLALLTSLSNKFFHPPAVCSLR